MLKISSATDIGFGRAKNEDAFAIINEKTLVVADGMGGHVAGEIASDIIISTAQKILTNEDIINEDSLKKVILTANAIILDTIIKNPSYKGMGTTVTMLHCEDEIGYWSSVGDSRLYLLRNKNLTQITKDHSLVADLIALGTISKESAKNHSQRNFLTRAVGIEENLLVDTGKFDIKKGDIFLLCTDGLSSVLDDNEILNILLDPPYDNYADKLVKKVLSLAGKDNITAIVATKKS